MKRIVQVSGEEKKRAYLIGFLLPIAGLFYSISNFRLPYAKNIFLIFCVFFGFVFIYNPEGGSGADGVRYAANLVRMHLSTQSFQDLWGTIYADESNQVDIYQPVLTFIVSRFTDNAHFLFLSFALVFGYFYSRNLWFIFEKINTSVTYPLAIFMIGYALVCPIWEINGVRMWTALQVFAFGALPYLIQGNKKSLFWCGLSIFFHFSFIVPVMILGVFYFLPKDKLTLYFIFFVITSFVSELNLSMINNIVSSYAPSFLMGKVDSYVSETTAVVQKVNYTTAWHAVLSGKLYRYITYTMFITMYFFGRDLILQKRYLLNIFSFSLFIYSIANVLVLIPSGGRFLTISLMFVFPAFILFLNRFKYINNIKQISQAASIVFLFVVIFKFRNGSEFFGITILGNPVLSLFLETRTPFIQFVKELFGIG